MIKELKRLPKYLKSLGVLHAGSNPRFPEGHDTGVIYNTNKVPDWIKEHQPNYTPEEYWTIYYIEQDAVCYVELSEEEYLQQEEIANNTNMQVVLAKFVDFRS